MQIGHKMTELEAFEVLSVVLEHPVHISHFSAQFIESKTKVCTARWDGPIGKG